MKYKANNLFLFFIFGAFFFPFLAMASHATFPQPTVDIRVNGSDGPVTITPGSSVTVSWTSTGTRECVILFNDSHWTGVNGSRQSDPITISRTYTADCSGSGGFVLDSVKVEVYRPTPSLIPVANAQEPTVLGAATVVTGPEDLLIWVFIVGFIGSLFVYAFVFQVRFRKNVRRAFKSMRLQMMCSGLRNREKKLYLRDCL